jgi:spore germination protein YaaH
MIVSHTVAPLKLSGWVVFDDDGTSYRAFKQHASQLDSVSFSWIGCDEKGALHEKSHPNSAEKTEMVRIAKKAGTKIFAMAVNEGFTPAGLERVMASPELMKAHAAKLIAIALQAGIDGLDLDYESLKAVDRDNFTGLVREICTAAHKKGLKVVIAVHSKESEPGNWDGPIAQNLAELGKLVDSVRIMTYDYHWETSDAGPIAPPDWVNSVMTFCTTQIPAAKLEMGIPGYGYDWLAKKAHGITWAEWSKLLAENGPALRDEQSQELVLKYKGRTVFFSDAASNTPKVPIASRLSLRGLALWRLGSEDPKLWDLLSRNHN